MEDASMKRALAAKTGLSVALLLACAAPARDKPQASHASPQVASDQAMLTVLPGARDAGERVISFLTHAPSTAAFTPDGIGRAMGATLGPDPNNDAGWAVYHSQDLGRGWTYWVQFAAGESTMKPGFRFWFDHADPAADAGPVCALPFDRLRVALTTHGWAERPVPSELGSVLAVEFAKADMVVTLTPRDGADVHGTACVLTLQTSDGR
ncbi:hypothetical protein KPL74_04610 [Bacillus sp. NP157]|nr:hypothetical protein KPL74_04610 [Bacillus sp. NP157]